MGSQDATITYLHRLITLNPIVSKLADWAERNPFIEEVSTIIYRKILKSKTDLLYNQMLTIIDKIYTTSTKLLIDTTYIGLAYQLALIKKRLEREKIYLQNSGL